MGPGRARRARSHYGNRVVSAVLSRMAVHQGPRNLRAVLGHAKAPRRRARPVRGPAQPAPFPTSQARRLLKAAHATCIRGLEDPRTHPSARTALQRRLARVQEQLQLPWREKRRFEEVVLRTPHEHVMFATLVIESVGLKPQCWWPDLAAHGGEDGGRDAGHGDEDQGEVPALQVGVEEYALRSYLAHEGFAGGSCSENSIFCTLFGLLFFDELFAPSVLGVFETPYQLESLDLGSECFYRSRQAQIERKLAQIESGDFISIMERVDRAEREEKTLISGIKWGLTWDDLALVAKDYYHNAAGMPDLC
ncbi:hypothetical protein AMAG_18334 [Allomyces macrogynus ATCC 38327]|uniref:Fanconi-associated nuclease n=1 Tax=Allomyces macrogynus (strain ATCC 38327) TaxID=578462 RepID=A0A0L0S8L3_ALLM3|nr:hypothetical protein AMAG_18334 [Allomyces macrogynus ATCC 38327]|eukprot:KNE58938.1 hypothetical protein AMAG_18334 [Allomyces macrogynus ATCC 38327]